MHLSSEAVFLYLVTFLVGIGSNEQNDHDENTQTVLDLIVKSGTIVNHADWKNYISDDTDLDGDGVISESELEQKYKHHLKTFFNILDTDSDGLINGNEIKSPKLDLVGIKQIFDIAIDLYPIKYWFNIGDANKDGAVDKDDFRDKEKWETFKKFILLADNDNDEKVTLGELGTKVKLTLKGVFELLDQNEDSYLSIEDFTTINIFLLKVPGVFEHFDSAIKTSKIHLLKLIPAQYRRNIDTNNDGLLNLKDFYHRQFGPRYIPREGYLMAQISRTLDKNQDSQINRQEIQDFFITFFGLIDNDGNGRITLKDGYTLLENNGAKKNQMEAIKDYVNKTLAHIGNEFHRAVKYTASKADKNEDGVLDLAEFEDPPLDCCIVCNNHFRFENFPKYPPLIKFMDLNKEKVFADLLDNPAFYNTYDVAIFDSIKKIDTVIPIMKAMGAIITVLIFLILVFIIVIICLVRKLKKTSKVDIAPEVENVKEKEVCTDKHANGEVKSAI